MPPWQHRIHHAWPAFGQPSRHVFGVDAPPRRLAVPPACASMCSMPTRCQSDWIGRPPGPCAGRRKPIYSIPDPTRMLDRPALGCSSPAAGFGIALRVPATAPARPSHAQTVTPKQKEMNSRGSSSKPLCMQWQWRQRSAARQRGSSAALRSVVAAVGAGLALAAAATVARRLALLAGALGATLLAAAAALGIPTR